MAITSRQHPLVKLARALHASKGRREHGLFVIEGKNAVEAALQSDFPIQDLLADELEQEIADLALDKGINVVRATKEVMTSASETQTAVPVIAFGQLSPNHSAQFPNFMLVLDGISDPGNVGTLWRAADAAGANGVLSLGGADPYSPKVIRSSAGSTFHLPPLFGGNSPETLVQKLQDENIPIICAQAHGAQNCYEFEWPKRAALVLGHETRGISPELAEKANYNVTIPVFGRAESLNAAMAGTILLYAWAQFQTKDR